MSTRSRQKKYFTVDEANATLPLVSSILNDITRLANDLKQRHDVLQRMREGDGLTPAHQEELQSLIEEFEREQDHMQEFEQELRKLGIELKDYFTGLVDFPCWMNNHEVYLCWRLGEPEVAYWHELDAGFAGRKQLPKRTAPQA